MADHAKHFIIVCFPLIALQTAYLFIPDGSVLLFNQGLRPLVLGVTAIYLYVFAGLDLRPVPMADRTRAIAVITAAIYGLVVIVFSYFLGMGTNIMAANAGMILWNLWHWGTVVLFGELIRYKLIKTAKDEHRLVAAVVLAAVLAYSRLNDLRYMIAGDIELTNFIYSSVLQTVAVSAMASYFSIRGSFASVILVNGLFTMFPLLSPLLPHIEPLPWALIVSLQAFCAIVLAYLFANDKGYGQNERIKRMVKYEEKPFTRYVIPAVVWGVVIMFFMGFLPFYPRVVLTDSMTGALNRGSVAIIERVHQRDVYARVGEMEIIHFNHSGLDFIHRVIAFRYDRYGEREFITKGDANDVADPFPVTQADVYGIARFYLPFVGHPVVLIYTAFRR